MFIFLLKDGENPPIYVYAEDKFHQNEKGEFVYYVKQDNFLVSILIDVLMRL